MKKGLGRGLDALLETKQEGQLSEIEIHLIDVNKEQPRKNFDRQKLAELAESIKELGVLQPLLLEKNIDRYTIIAGERRFRAALLAGLKRVPAIVRNFSNAEKLEAALIENIQREDLNPIEEANAIYELMQKCGYTQEDVAQRLSKARSSIANNLRLLKLCKEVQAMLVSGEISEGHGRALCGIDDEARQLKLARTVVDTGMSVRELERLVSLGERKNAPAKASKSKSHEFIELEDKILFTLGARAEIKGDLDKGKIIISYKHRDELESLYEAIEELYNKKK